MYMLAPEIARGLSAPTEEIRLNSLEINLTLENLRISLVQRGVKVYPRF
jgi:hypothetical protein